MSQQKVQDKWSAFEPDVLNNFFGFPALRPYLIRTAYGEDTATDYADKRFWSEDIFVERYLYNREQPIRRVLSLACGFGHVEQRIISQLDGVEHCLGLDIAEGALKVATERATASGLGNIEYQWADLNAYDWQPETYDLVIANGALHHLANLEAVVAGIKKTLKPGGLLYANEHVGATYQDYPKRQLELINATAYLVPPNMRERVGAPFSGDHLIARLFKKLYNIPHPNNRPHWSPVKKNVASFLRNLIRAEEGFRFGIVHDSQRQDLIRTDPSEGVRSADIIPLLKQTFPEITVRSYGGGILAYALDTAFYRNYDDTNPQHRQLLDLLCALENHYTQTGEIGIEYGIIIAMR